MMTSTVQRNAFFFLSTIAVILVLICADGEKSCVKDGSCASSGKQPYYATWEDAPSSADEFDHDNDKSVCGLPLLTVEEWEQGRYWEGDQPVLVKNVTDGWPALQHWTK